LVKQNIEVCHSGHIEQDATFRVFGYRAAVDADAGAVGYFEEFGEELTELGRPCFLDLVGAVRNEEVRIFERRHGEGIFSIKQREGEGTLYCSLPVLVCRVSVSCIIVALVFAFVVVVDTDY